MKPPERENSESANAAGLSAMPQLAKYKALALDLDGTLLDTRFELVASCQESARVHGFGFDQTLAEGHCGHGVYKMLDEVAPQLTKEEVEIARKTFLDYYRDNLGTNTPWMPGARELVERFEQRGLPVAIVTNKSKELTTLLLQKLGLSERFYPVVCRDTFEVAKPDPFGIHHVLSELKVDRSELLWVGDSCSDGEAGRNAGVDTLLLRSGMAPVEELKGWGEWQVDSLLDIV